ncbi:MAG TPA: SDR family oxidoreductase [Mycobacteriales bacterium]|nr:SDR family oxidoreductase [Mycobacteriales bacterium]
MTTSVVIGGSAGLGRFIATRFAERGDDVVISSRDASRASAVAGEIDGAVTGIAVDLSDPAGLEAQLATITDVDNLVLTAISQFPNTLREFNIAEATAAVVTKLVGYPEVVRLLHPRMSATASVVLFGGVAKDRPYPGSTIVTTHNGGITALARTLAIEIAPHRVNALHPGVVGDSPKWSAVPEHPAIPRTPIGRLAKMAEIADATDFLLSNGAINAQDLVLDGGFSFS